MQDAAAGRASLIELHGPRLLQDVDHSIGVAPYSDWTAGVGQCPQRADPITKIAFGGGAHADGDSIRPERGDVVLVDMDRVYRCQVMADRIFDPAFVCGALAGAIG